MALNLFTTHLAFRQSPAASAQTHPVYPRLIPADPPVTLARRGRLGAIGSALLDLPSLAWITLDVAVVSTAVYLAYLWSVWVPQGGWLTISWRETCLVQAIALILAGLVFGLYEQQTLLRRSRIIARSVLSIAGATAVTFIVFHLFMYEDLSRRVLLMAGLLYLAVGPTLRLLAGWCVNSHSRTFLIVGTDRRSRLSQICPEAASTDGLSRRYRLVGYVSMDSHEVGRQVDGAIVVGTIENIERICLELGVDEVVVGPGPAKNPRVLDRMLGCLKLGCRVTHLSTFYEQVMSEVPVAHLEPSWFLFADLKHYREAQLMMKRAGDLLLATIGLLITLPFWPLIGLLVRLDTRGPVFYHQRRVGLNGRTFNLHKFRTMRDGAESNGHVWAAVDDPRITRFGWYLRKTRLDELPQLWNILLGQMSVVGPRPERPEFVSELAGRIRYYNERHLIKPGLTGWAQINYRYGASVEDARRKLQLDLWYIKHMSVELDLIILLRTVGTVLLTSR